MYNLPYFKDKDRESILAFIRQHPFAFISGATTGGQPVATQIPVFIEEREGKLFLSGHMMRGTDHFKAFEQNPQALCVFTGPHAYVSATWYTDPYQGSTWNYMSVHARGTLRFQGEAALEEVLRKTSLHFEGGNAAAPTVFDNLPQEYRDRLLKAIAAFEVEVEALDHVFKLSQNRDRQSYEQIEEKLRAGDAGARAVADEMARRKEELFGKEEKE